MTEAEKYRLFAINCRMMAHEFPNSSTRLRLLEIAKLWDELSIFTSRHGTHSQFRSSPLHVTTVPGGTHA